MIEVSRIREGNGNIEAFVDIRTDEALIKGFRVVKEDDGYFVGLPSRKGSDGKYHAQYIPGDELKAEIERVIMNAFTEFNPSDKTELSDMAVKISDRLHRGEDTILGKRVLNFKDGKVRAVDTLGYRFITQNPDKDSESGALAREGRLITWVIKDKEWIGKVVDGAYEEL